MRIEYLDQTRIHQFQYDKLRDIVAKCVCPGQDLKDDSLSLHNAVFELLKNPSKLIDSISEGGIL